jgi:hypothetical protein
MGPHINNSAKDLSVLPHLPAIASGGSDVAALESSGNPNERQAFEIFVVLLRHVWLTFATEPKNLNGFCNRFKNTSRITKEEWQMRWNWCFKHIRSQSHWKLKSAREVNCVAILDLVPI